MRHTFDSLASDKNWSDDTCGIWLNKYYQLGNRLAFLHHLSSQSIPTKLVLLNFVGDPTYKPTSTGKWNSHYKEIFTDMLGSESTPPNVLLANFDVG